MTRKSGSLSYSVAYLKDLRFRVIERLVRNMNGIYELEDMLISPGSNHNTYYENISEDILFSTKKRISESTTYKLLYLIPKKHQDKLLLQKDRTFEVETIEIFEEYSRTIRTSIGNFDSKIDSQKLHGAQLINFAFVNKLSDIEIKEDDHENFYLGKNHNDLQWLGIARRWDYSDRDLNKIVKENVINSFETDGKVLAVIYGDSGSGKSTFLRRLAIDCIFEKFNVLWVTEIGYFFENDIKIISNSSEKFLLILDDWQSLKPSPLLISTLLNVITNSNNIKLVVGDNNSIESNEYYPHLIEKGEYELLNNDNEKIINWVIGINRAWKTAAEHVLKSTEFYNAQIYMILFVLARLSEAAVNKKTSSIIFRFRNIVRGDLKKIYDGEYYGIALAIYYWSSLYMINQILLSWRGFLKLADYYQENNKCSSRLLSFDLDNPVCKILSRYISLENFIVPNLEHKQVFYFHHNLLITEGLSRPFYSDLFFNETIKLELVKALIYNDELKDAVELTKVVFADIKGLADRKLKKRLEHLSTCRSGLYHEFALNEYLKKLYSEVDVSNDENKWKNRLFAMLFYFDKSDYIKTVLFNLIKKGCKVKCIQDAYERSVIDKHYLLGELKTTLSKEYLDVMENTNYEFTVKLMVLNYLPIDIPDGPFPYTVYKLDPFL